ncbi:hypothetical protein ACSBR2_023921 [Camellia fascicularis]
MMNGEGTRGETSSEVASPDPLDEFQPWQSPKSDDESPVNSQYSSCGESEFERYCSANSMMGTPSLCSSIGTFQDCADSEFGSMRSFNSLENFSLGGGFARKLGERRLSLSGGSGCLVDPRIESGEGKNSSEVTNDVELRGEFVGRDDGMNSQHQLNCVDTGDVVLSKVGSESDLLAVLDLSTVLGEELYAEDDGGGIVRWRDHSESAMLQSSAGSVSVQQITNVEAVDENVLGRGVNSDTHSSARVIEPVDSCLDELCSGTDVEFDVGEGGRCSDEDKASSRFEHSEGEDSMFGYGTDDEQKMKLVHQRNTQYHQEARSKKENSLLMSSSVAFGADDWDDFVQETGQSDITSIMLEKREPNTEFEGHLISFSSRADTGFPGVDISESSNQVQGADELEKCIKNGSATPVDFLDFRESEKGKDAEDTVTINQDGDLDELEDYLKTCPGSDILERELDPPLQGTPLNKGLNLVGGNLRKESPLCSTQEFDNVGDSRVSESQESEKLKVQLDPLSDIKSSQLCLASTEKSEEQMADFVREPCPLLSMDENNIKRPLKDSPASFNLFEDHPKAIKVENLELNEFYCEVVHEMEEILLDSTESPGARFTQRDMVYRPHLPLPLRDGGSTASTSGNDNAHNVVQRPLTIDGVEVVGAKQKKGDVSFGERLVGVKEYTVYIIRVWSGKDHWEVERRYRDFCTLYRRLKTLFSGQGWILPSSWSSVERESRKIFGNVSPDVVAERSALIQECLRSILHSRFSSSLPSALIWFLSPQTFLPSSPASNKSNPQSPFSARSTDTDNVLTFGKTISLIVEIRPNKSMKQILEAQHYICAGCYKHFDDGKTQILDFVQTLGWGKPRLCEYTGQLFCSSCHTNETSVLPARVLHHWDFAQYPVSQLAKSYLDSIYDQPMLCVSAVNPFLFSKVPALVQVTGVRRKIGAMLPFVRCPFRMSIYKGLSSRRYLLESNDFFALRDLIDLSKGAFAALPVVVDTVSSKILEHITEQCLICCDVGVPCNARQACDDPSSLIFPFQEGEIERCRSCKVVFHKLCFKKITSCPCGERLKQDREQGGSANVSHRVDSTSGALDLFGRKSDSTSTVGFFSRLFSKASPEKSWGAKDSDTVILMGSLPSTSL